MRDCMKKLFLFSIFIFSGLFGMAQKNKRDGCFNSRYRFTITIEDEAFLHRLKELEKEDPKPSFSECLVENVNFNEAKLLQKINKRYPFIGEVKTLANSVIVTIMTNVVDEKSFLALVRENGFDVEADQLVGMQL